MTFIVKKFNSLKGCVICKYSPSLNNLYVFGDEEFFALTDKVMRIIENHYSVVSREQENLSELKNEIRHCSVLLNKTIYDLVKHKFEVFKKQFSIRFDVKQKKENKVTIEWDYNDESINERIVKEIDLQEFYLENLKLPEEFFSNENFPSLKYYLEKFKSGIVSR